MTRALVLACMSLFLTTCAEKPEPRLPPLSKDEISGERVWKRITVETDFDSYASWPGHEGLRPGQSPHGKFHEVYINYLLAEALPIADKKAPDGAIIVKENFNSDKKETNLTVMVKARGYNPDAGDWFWANFDPDGTVRSEGRLKGCIDCHSGVADNDYVIIRPLDAPVPEVN